MTICCRVDADLKVIWGYEVAAGLDDKVDGFEMDFFHATVHFRLHVRSSSCLEQITAYPTRIGKVFELW